jgi:NADPH:quinone reductase-like Zn-dependent oxidoreductase
MQAYYFDHLGTGLNGLMLGERPEPKPGRNEVLIKVHARSLNYRDLLILTGRYAFAGKTGKIALSDGAGEVVALGEGVTRVTIGDRVACGYFPRWLDGSISMELAAVQFGCTLDGMLAPFAVADEQAVVKIPAHLSYQEAATLPCAAVTAWSSLTGPRPVLPGDTILTIGTGGVALFALQLAKLFGTRVIAITSTSAKAARLKQLGADDVVNYRSSPDWDVQILRLTGGHGVEHVVETGGLDTLPKSIACAADQGVINVVAALGQGAVDASVFRSRVLIRRIYVGSRTQFETMNRAIALHRLRPVIDRVFSFSEAKQAYQHFEARQHIGKVVIANTASTEGWDND